MEDEEQRTTYTHERERARAVFSPEDFKLIQTAIAHYLKEISDKPESVKYSNLYHRLGRIT